MKKSFTIIELIFVMVIIAILSAIAIPKFTNQLKETNLLKIKNEVRLVKTGIANEMNNNFLQDIDECPDLEKNLTDDYVFENVLGKPIKKNEKNIKWSTSDGINYTVKFEDFTANFKYNNDINKKCFFECKDDSDFCNELNNE